VLAAVIGLLVCGCKPPSIRVAETPIRIQRETTGYGDPVRDGDQVVVDYHITLPDGGKVLDQKNFRFTVGTGTVIRGIDEAILGMRPGGTREFNCPPHKHWGRAGYGGGVIPPATDLRIELRLARIESRTRMRTGAVTKGSE
jgi:FKBP-type peptidyl-prolyl cis-trans isomerase